METLTKILEYNPILTLIFGFILALVAMWLFREEIKAYIKKKYNLFDEEQVLNLIQQSVKEDRKKQEILREFKKLKG
jgi:hypothetical protein